MISGNPEAEKSKDPEPTLEQVKPYIKHARECLNELKAAIETFREYKEAPTQEKEESIAFLQTIILQQEDILKAMEEGKIAPITSSHDLLNKFFFPFCNTLDDLFYGDNTYPRGFTGSSYFQDLIMEKLWDSWDKFNNLDFQDRPAPEILKSNLLLETLLRSNELFEKRNPGQTLSLAAETNYSALHELIVKQEISYQDACDMLIQAAKIATEPTDKHFFEYLYNYFLKYPPIIDRERAKITNIPGAKEDMYVDIWHPKEKPIKGKMVYVHGWHDSPESGKMFIQQALAEGIEVHAIHLRGHGFNHSKEVIPTQELVDQFKQYYKYVDDGTPLIVAGHSMGGAIIATALDPANPQINTTNLKEAVFFAPAFSTGYDLAGEKNYATHRNLHKIVLAKQDPDYLFNPKGGPRNPVMEFLTTSVGLNSYVDLDTLYRLMRSGHEGFKHLINSETNIKVTLVWGDRDMSVNCKTLSALADSDSVVKSKGNLTLINHPEFDHGAHMAPGGGAGYTCRRVIASLHDTLEQTAVIIIKVEDQPPIEEKEPEKKPGWFGSWWS